jgi:hypothetical protein
MAAIEDSRGWMPPRTAEELMEEMRRHGGLVEWHNPWAESPCGFEENIWLMLQNFPEATKEDIESYLNAVGNRLSREDYEKFLAEEGEAYIERGRAYFEGLSEEELGLYESRLSEHPAFQAYYEPLWFEVYEAEVELAATAEGQARRPFHEKQEPYPGTGRVAVEQGKRPEEGDIIYANFGFDDKGEIITKPRVFRGNDAKVRATEELLGEIPPWLAYGSMSGAALWARPELILRLYKWREEIYKACKKKDPKYNKRIKIAVNSCYRVLGTTAGAGEWLDPSGVKDSNDPLGHWTGFAVDVSCLGIASQTDGLLSADDVRAIVTGEDSVVGLVNQYESWHFRLSREYLP